jgi:hypothetical protein
VQRKALARFRLELNDLSEDRWTSADMRNAAHVALKQIRGSG